MKVGTRKRTPEQAMAAVEEAKTLIKEGMTVASALSQLNLQPSTWHKYKNTRRPYAKKAMIVSEVEPIKLTGTKTMFIVTEDPEVIARLLERLS